MLDDEMVCFPTVFDGIVGRTTTWHFVLRSGSLDGFDDPSDVFEGANLAFDVFCQDRERLGHKLVVDKVII